MKNNPWHIVDNEQVLFILDAAHEVEETLLHEWLKKTRHESGHQGQANYCVVPIARDPENIPTESLSDAIKEQKESLLLVPLRVIWKTTLDEVRSKPRWRDLIWGNPRRPGERKARRIINTDPSQASCVYAKPATLGELAQRFENHQDNAQVYEGLADYVLQQASLALEVAERRLRGTRYKVPRHVSRIVRASDRYKQGILAIARETGEPETVLRQRAVKYFKELIALPHNFWQDVVGAMNRWIISLGYSEKMVVDTEKLEEYRSIVRKHPSAFLWTHKTHMDGISMQSVLFENDFPPPHTMGGINMAFFGIGFMARRAGAIFIRRSFHDKPVYKLALREYLAYLLEKRFPLTWAFEGTRSRVGKLMPPRYGMLKYVMDAVQNSSADHLYIIPVAINYDLNPDVKDYALEQSGGVKRPESLTWFLSYLRRMRQPLGRIYMDFGDPVIVEKTVYQDDSQALEKIAYDVGVEVNRITPITLTSLLSMVLLGTAPRAQTITEICQSLQELHASGLTLGARFTADYNGELRDNVLKLIETMVNAEVINRHDEGLEIVYTLAEEKQVVASYYRNTIVHHFLLKAIVELALIEAAVTQLEDREMAFWQEVYFLRDLFKYDFFYAPKDDLKEAVQQVLSQQMKNWPTALSSKSKTLDLLNSMKPLIAHATLTPYIEAYRVMADVFARLEPTKTLEEKAAISAAFKYGKQAYLQRRISSKASMGQLMFANAYKAMQSLGMSYAGGCEVEQTRKQTSQRFRVLSHRIEQIRTLAMPYDFD